MKMELGLPVKVERVESRLGILPVGLVTVTYDRTFECKGPPLLFTSEGSFALKEKTTSHQIMDEF